MTDKGPDRSSSSYASLIKKKEKNSRIYNEIQMGSGAKSYMKNGFLIFEEMHKYFHHT
jgi:hypothetical protein